MKWTVKGTCEIMGIQQKYHAILTYIQKSNENGLINLFDKLVRLLQILFHELADGYNVKMLIKLYL